MTGRGDALFGVDRASLQIAGSGDRRFMRSLPIEALPLLWDGNSLRGHHPSPVEALSVRHSVA